MDEVTQKQQAKPERVSVVYNGGMLTGDSAELVAGAMADMECRRKKTELAEQRWGSPDDVAGRMTRLCQDFPSLRGKPGTAPWDTDTLLSWACGPAPSSGAIHAVRFVLNVWNTSTNWIEIATELDLDGAECLEPFNLAQAWACWDDGHRTAALAWLELPFFP